MKAFDVPSIVCAILANPTKSLAKFVQRKGRALRRTEDKDKCIILDQTGNLAEKGWFINSFTRENFSIDGKMPEEKKGMGVAKVCEKCGAMSPGGQKFCMNCGAEFPVKTVDLPLTEMQKLDPFDKDTRKEFYRNAKREAYQKGWSPASATVKFKNHYHCFPPLKKNSTYDLFSIFGRDNSTPLNREKFANYLIGVALKKEKDASWIAFHYEREFGFKPEFDINLEKPKETETKKQGVKQIDMFAL